MSITSWGLFAYIAAVVLIQWAIAVSAASIWQGQTSEPLRFVLGIVLGKYGNIEAHLAITKTKGRTLTCTFQHTLSSNLDNTAATIGKLNRSFAIVLMSMSRLPCAFVYVRCSRKHITHDKSTS